MFLCIPHNSVRLPGVSDFTVIDATVRIGVLNVLLAGIRSPREQQHLNFEEFTGNDITPNNTLQLRDITWYKHTA